MDEASDLAKSLLEMLVRDIRNNGLLHEYYNPETGEGMTNPGFVNWNMLAGIMYDEFVKGEDCTAI